MKKEGMAAFEVQPPSVIIGPQYTRVNIMVKKTLRAVRVDFCPGGLHRLLVIPMTRLFDEGLDTMDIWGHEVRSVNEQISNTEDMQERAGIVERFLLQKAAGRKTLQPLDEALRMLMKSDGKLPIENIASLACLSLRQFERKCAERLGLSPKMFARIVRFSKAYRIREAQPGITWTSIAYEAGYYDQMHLIRDFKEFAGVTPSLLEEDLLQTPFRMQAGLID
jgi:AraC-like DNA-binding protein